MPEKKITKKLDYILLALMLVLIGFGVIAIASATGALREQSPYYTLLKMHLIWIMAGLAVFFVVMLIDYNVYGILAPYMYVIAIIPLMILVFIPSLGHNFRGATSWFKIGSQQIQPSEFAKIVFILTFARHLDKLREKDEGLINKPYNILLLLLHAAIPVGLIVVQPDYGIALVFCAILAGMIFVANLNTKYILTLVGGVLAVFPIMFFYILPKFSPHAMNRIQIFLNPELDPKGKGYQPLKAKLAIGSGQLWGQNIGDGMQSQAPKGGLPIKESDFIFAVLGEELGFVGASLLVLLYIMLLLKLVHVARTAKDSYGSYVVVGVAGMLSFHMFQNIGMTIGLMPITGIPLPFISYGGSNFVSTMIGMGLVMSVSIRRQKRGFGG